VAAIRGSLPAVQALVKRGAAVNRKGWTPLHYACSGPDNGVAAFLIAQGAELNARSENGTTPLMMAARYGNSDLVPLLIKAGAEPRAANEQELTAADFAQRGGRDLMAKELRRAIQERQRAAEAAKIDKSAN
jgi:ankyrin repeat protein